MPPAKRTPAKGAVDLHKLGARVVSVYGPFNSRVMFEMSAEAAAMLFSKDLGLSGRTNVVDALERELAELRKVSPELADSALAVATLQLAYEIEHPYNSATSKANCHARIQEAMDRLRELAPTEEKKGVLHDIKSGRTLRLAEGSAAGSD